MRHVMVDLETLGTTPGCCLLSIGACAFDPAAGELHTDTFYTAILQDGQEENGLHVSASTEAWWAKQSPEARKVFTDPTAIFLPMALTAFNVWLLRVAGPDALVYGNGADFDNPVMSVAYKVADVPQGWKAYNGRCYRTLKALLPAVKLVRTGTHHNALGDAQSQAEHLCRIAQAGGYTLG